MPNGTGWLVTIGAVGGSVGGFGGAALLFRFLNAKINKVDESKDRKVEKLDMNKQDRTVCDSRFQSLKEGLQRVENKIDVGVVVAKDDLQRVVAKLDQGTDIQNSIQKEISLMLRTMKQCNSIDEKNV